MPFDSEGVFSRLHNWEDDRVNDIDIVPTIINLFGIDYDPNNYIGTDVFSKYHK